MYQDPKKNYWWSGMKKNIVEYVVGCVVCQQIRIEHQNPGGLLQKLEVLEGK